MARGGFFKSIGKFVSKAVSTVTKVPVLGVVAKAAIGSLPVVGQVVTAVNAFKGKTPVGAAASPVGGLPPVPGALQTFSVPPAASGTRVRAPRRRKAKKKAKRRATRGKRKGGGTAKQRAARARFAKAAKRGRIKKGQRL